MPDFYQRGEYDLSGFAVGIVKKQELVDGKKIRAGDVLVGVPSSGVHSNGFSLVRRCVRQEIRGSYANPKCVGCQWPSSGPKRSHSLGLT